MIDNRMGELKALAEVSKKADDLINETLSNNKLGDSEKKGSASLACSIFKTGINNMADEAAKAAPFLGNKKLTDKMYELCKSKLDASVKWLEKIEIIQRTATFAALHVIWNELDLATFE